MTYVVAAAVVLAVNLLPAFGPPTWSILVLFRLRSHLNPLGVAIQVILLVGVVALARVDWAKRLGHSDSDG